MPGEPFHSHTLIAALSAVCWFLKDSRKGNCTSATTPLLNHVWSLWALHSDFSPGKHCNCVVCRTVLCLSSITHSFVWVVFGLFFIFHPLTHTNYCRSSLSSVAVGQKLQILGCAWSFVNPWSLASLGVLHPRAVVPWGEQGALWLSHQHAELGSGKSSAEGSPKGLSDATNHSCLGGSA